MHEKSPVVIPDQQAVADVLGSALHREFGKSRSFHQQPLIRNGESFAGAPNKRPLWKAAAVKHFSDSAFTADKVLSTRLSFTVAPDAYQPGAMCDDLKKKYEMLACDGEQQPTTVNKEGGETVNFELEADERPVRRLKRSASSGRLSIAGSPVKNQEANSSVIFKAAYSNSDVSEPEAASASTASEVKAEKTSVPQSPDPSPLSETCTTPPPRESALDVFLTPMQTPTKLHYFQSPAVLTPIRSPVSKTPASGSPAVSPAVSQASSAGQLSPSKSPVIGSLLPPESQQNSTMNRTRSTSGSTSASGSKRPASPKKATNSAGLPSPLVDLFSANRLNGCWPSEQKCPRPGMQNAYSNCYANSAIQCIFNCPHFVNLLLRSHDCVGRCIQGCSLCWMRTIALSFNKPSQNIYNTALINFIRDQPSLRLYHHEDAQEFILLLLERMHLDYIRGYRAVLQRSNSKMHLPKHIDCFTEYTTPINRIFSGFYCQQIQCMHCLTLHDPTYQPFRDIPLDVSGNGFDIRAGLKRFSCVEEMTDADNLYDCEKCKKKCRAKKLIRIYRAPPVLMFQFKRFRRARFSLASKISAPADVPLDLDLRPYMSGIKNDDDDDEAFSSTRYQLSGGVLHHGSSLAGGHYTAVCRGARGKSFYEYDDTYVTQIRTYSHLNNLLSRAYVVFYQRVEAAKNTATGPAKKQLVEEEQKKSVVVNGTRNISPAPSMAPKEKNLLSSLMAAYGSGDNDDDDSAVEQQPPSAVPAALPSPRKPIVYNDNSKAAQQQQRLPPVQSGTPSSGNSVDSVILSASASPSKIEARQTVKRNISVTGFYGSKVDSDNNTTPNKRMRPSEVIVASNGNSTVRYNKQVQQDPFNNYNDRQQQHRGNFNRNINTAPAALTTSPTRRGLDSNYTMHAAASSSGNNNNNRRKNFIPRQVQNANRHRGRGGGGGNHRGGFLSTHTNKLKGFIF